MNLCSNVDRSPREKETEGWGRSDQPEEMSTASLLIVGNIYTHCTCIVFQLYCIVFVSLLRNAKFSAANSSPALMAILSIAEIHIQNTLDTNGDCCQSFSKTAASGRNI